MNTLSNCCRIVSQTLQLNSSVKLSPVERWKVEVYRYVVPMMLLLCFVSFSANVFILITTRWLKKSLTPNLVFTLSLTATDAWVSLAMGVGLALNSYLPIVKQLDVLGRSSFCFNLAYEALRVGAMITSIFHLLALASNHYVTILKPLKYYSTVTADVIVPVVLSMWLLPPAGFLLYFSLLPGQAFRSDYCRGIGFLIQFKFRLFVAATIFIPLVIMMFLYAHILLLIIKSRRRQSLGFRRASLPSNQKFQSVTTTALMLGTYVLGWLPNVLFFISHCENCFFPLQNYGLQVFWLTVFTNALIIFKCIVDPIIYGARVNEIREALLLMNLRCLAAVHRNPSKFDTRRRRTGLMNITMADPSRMYYDRKTDRITTSKVVPYGSIPYCSIAIEQEKFFPRDGLNQENNRIEPLLPDAANDSVWQRQDTWNSSRNDC